MINSDRSKEKMHQKLSFQVFQNDDVIILKQI